jgi:hypothetical protein
MTYLANAQVQAHLQGTHEARQNVLFILSEIVISTK